jgi:hypothetical protein
MAHVVQSGQQKQRRKFMSEPIDFSAEIIFLHGFSGGDKQKDVLKMAKIIGI